MRKREETRSTKHEQSIRRKIWCKLPLIGVLLALAICLGLFIANQQTPVQTDEADRVETSSSKKKRTADKKVQKSGNATSSPNTPSANADTIATPTPDKAEQPNAGKVLKYDNIEAAEAAMKRHDATCPYDTDYCYTGAVYTGTYQCKCGLKIIWWDKAVKESVNRDMESFRDEGTDDSEYNYDTSDPWPDIPTENGQTDQTEASSVDEGQN